MPTTITPTLFIGLGGTGASIINNIKRALYQTPLAPDAAGDWKPPYFEFLTIDIVDPTTAAVRTEARDCIDEELATATDDFLAITVPQSRVRQLREVPDNYSNIWNWLSREAFSGVDSLLNGAGQRRMLGRVAFCMNFYTIRDRIERKLRTLRKKIADAAVEANYSLGSQPNDKKIHFVVFNSLAGGTGSGCFLDLCFLIRALQSGEYGSDCVPINTPRGVSLFSLTNTVFPQQTKVGNFQSLNTYSSLLDLQHYGYFNNDGGYYADPYEPFSDTKEIKKEFHWNIENVANPRENFDTYLGDAPIADAVYLVDRSNFKNQALIDQFDAMDLVSQFVLFRYRYREEWKRILERADNPGDHGAAITRQLVHNATTTTQESPPVIAITKFRAIGLARTSSREETVRYAAAALLASDTAKEWIATSNADEVHPYNILGASGVYGELSGALRQAQRTADFERLFEELPNRLLRFDDEMKRYAGRTLNGADQRSFYGEIVSSLNAQSLGLVIKRCQATLSSMTQIGERKDEDRRKFEAAKKDLAVLEHKQAQLDHVSGLTSLFLPGGRAAIAAAIAEQRTKVERSAEASLRSQLASRTCGAYGIASFTEQLKKLIADLESLARTVGLVTWVSGSGGFVGFKTVFEALVPPDIGTGRDRFALRNFCRTTAGYEQHYRRLIQSVANLSKAKQSILTTLLEKLAAMRGPGSALDPLWRPDVEADARVGDVVRRALHLAAFDAMRNAPVDQIDVFDLGASFEDMAQPYVTLQQGLEEGSRARIQITNRTVRGEANSRNEAIRVVECLGYGLDSRDMEALMVEWEATAFEARLRHMSSKTPPILSRISNGSDMTKLSRCVVHALFHLVEGGVTLKAPKVEYVEDAAWGSSFVISGADGKRRFKRFSDVVTFLRSNDGSAAMQALERRTAEIFEQWTADRAARLVGFKVIRVIEFNKNLQEFLRRESRVKDVGFDANGSTATDQSVDGSTEHWYWRQLFAMKELRAFETHFKGEKPQFSPGNWRIESSSRWAPLFVSRDFPNRRWDFSAGIPASFSNGILCLGHERNDPYVEGQIMNQFSRIVGRRVTAPLDKYDGSGPTAFDLLRGGDALDGHPDYRDGVFRSIDQ